MEQKKTNSMPSHDGRIDDLIRMLDSGTMQGVGHINVSCSAPNVCGREVQTLGCPDCSAAPLACSVPTLHEGLDRPENE